MNKFINPKEIETQVGVIVQNNMDSNRLINRETSLWISLRVHSIELSKTLLT